jgi:hypothetical protein
MLFKKMTALGYVSYKFNLMRHGNDGPTQLPESSSVSHLATLDLDFESPPFAFLSTKDLEAPK